MDFLKVYQIFYKQEQLGGLDYLPVLNMDCTVFFENSVIRRIVENGGHLGSEYFGVVSWALRQKLDYTRKWGLKGIANESTTEFTPDLFAAEVKRHRPDVMSFQRHPSHDNVSLADRFHPDFSKYFGQIMSKIGFEWKPVVFEHVIYCNYFVAKSEIYESYVKEMLIPAMDVMKDMPELMKNSGYPKPLPSDLREKWGIAWYPYHSFLCERMFSYYCYLKGLRVVHY